MNASLFTMNCFEGFTIKQCCPGCCSRKKLPRPRIVLIQEMHFDLCIVNAPHQIITSLGADATSEGWDYLIVDCDKKAIMFAGPRFHEFTVVRSWLTETVDACKGTPLAELFHKSIVDIFIPLLNVALQGTPGQLHTIFKGQSLTFFVYPVMNENKLVIGASIIYRPTRYDVMDISKLISTTPTIVP